jgi:RHS repeat-associated protein
MTAGAQLSDFDGDGRDDVVLLWNARHHDREIVPGRIRMARAFGMGGPIGDWTPFADDMEFTHQRVWYQVRTGDIDGDKRGDLVLSRVGRQGTYDGGFLWWGHDSTYLYGKEVLGALGPLTGGAALDVHIRATARYRSWGTEPFLRYNEFNTSLADLNGDGLDDLVQIYRGWDGTDLDVALSTPAGSWSSGNAQDPSHHVATTNDSVCDGSHPNRRWRQVFGDLNGDGNTDLLMAHHGDCGRKMHAFHGRSVANHTVLGASGMTSEQAIQNNAIQVRGQSDPIFGGAHLSTTHLADVNGDGRDDIITLAIYNDPPPNPVRIYHALSRPGLPDRIWHVSEGLGRTYTVEYGRAHEMVAMVPTGGTARPIRHAPEPGASHGASVVGTPITAPRELVQRLIINTGRRLERQRYAYDNERWLRGEPGVRRPLGFETVWVIDEDTGQVRQTRYHHDPARAGYPAVITTWAPGAAANAAPGQPTPQYYPARIEERTYEVVSSYGGTRAVRLRETRTRDYRGDPTAPDALVRDVTRETHYDGFHHATEDTTCADGVCITRSTDYAHDPVGWKLGRVDNVRTHDGVHTHDWLRHYYRAGGRFYEVEQSERIRFDASSTAVCETMDCGPGRWIVVRQNVKYDAFGHVRYEEDALRGQTTTTRDPAYRTHVAQVTNAVGHDTRQEFDAMGRLQYVTDPNGYRDEIRYDAAGRPKELLRGAAGGVIQRRWEYLDFGDVTKQRVLLHVKSSATDEGVVARHLDGAGQPYEWVEGSHGDGAIHRLTAHGTASPQPAEGYVLSVSHRTETEVRPYLCQPGAPWCDEPARLTTRSDARGRPVEVKRTSQRRLDQNTWWAARTQPVAAYRYDYEGYPSNLAPQVGFEGRCETLLDPTRRTVSCFDERGNLMARGRGADGGPLLDATRYKYDAASRLTRVDLPGPDEVTFTWDSWGNRRSITDPQWGTVTWTYDDLGRVDTETDTLGNIIEYDYDAIGRTTEKRVRRGSQTVVIAYEYDNPGVPNSLGRLTRVSAPDLTMQILQFDAFGNPKFVAWTTPDHSQPFIYQHTFDWIGRETEKRFPDGKIQRNVFKPANGPLFEVFYDGVKLASFTSHDALGRVRSGSHGGTTTARTWYPDERLESLFVTNKRWDHLIFQKYEWDDAGNLMSITDQRQMNAPNSGADESASFAYDDLHRVTNATGPWGTHTFAYDGRGSFTRRNNQSYQYSTSPSLRAIYMPDGGLPGFYEVRDRAGNRTQIWDYRRSRWQTYSYDAENRLTSANVDGRTITFAYDAAGARVRKSFDDGAGITVTWTLGGGDYEVRHHSSNPYYTAVTRHIDTPNGRIATITDGYSLPGQPTTNEVYAHRTDPMTGDTTYGTPGGTWFLHAGLLGTTLLVTDVAGNQVTRYVHAPYGALQPVGSGWDTVTTRFTGKTWDAETRMFDFGVRYYDPWTATFLTADTVLPGDGQESQDWNRFAYAYGNPLRYGDPTGHKPAADPSTTGRQPILPPDHPDHPNASAFRQNFARALGAAGTSLSLVDSTFTGLTMAGDGGLLGSTGGAILGEMGILFRGAGFILNYGSLALFALRGTADPSAIGPIDALGASANTLVVVGDLTEVFANLCFTHGNARLALIGSRTSAVGASFGAGLLAGTLLDEGLTLTLGRSLGATVYDHVHHANNRYVQDHTWSVGLSNTSYGSLGYLKDLCQRSRDVLTCQRYAARGGKAEHLNFR